MVTILSKMFMNTEGNLDRCRFKLACDNVDNLPEANGFEDRWIIDMGSTAHIINTGETYMLNSDGKWKPQKKTDGEGVIFTEEDKAKLDSLTNPILLKGRVNTKEELEEIPNPETGWLYFVGSKDAGNFAEYIYTDGKKWEYIGDNSIDLSNYVKNTDIATNGGNAGLIKTDLSSGVVVGGAGYLSINRATNAQIEGETNQYRPLVPEHIPIFMQNYNITKTTIQDILDRLTILENPK